MAIGRILAVIVIAVVGALLPATAATANTAPNPYTPAGTSWVDVPTGDRVYFENFGFNFDDYAIFYVGAGITCTYNAVTATGPFVTSLDLTDSDCMDGASAPFDPIDTATRVGSTPFGFPINFFGTTYTSAYPNTNGGIFFDNPNSEYDETLAYLASSSGSSAMFPLGADLYYDPTESNFWVAQTTVDGLPAIVFTWERFNNCCNPGPSPDDMSFQLVLMNVGAGDFNAWFNFASLEAFDQGYTGPTALINLSTGVTVGSNVLTAQDVTGVPTVCTEGYMDEFGTATDTVLIAELNTSLFFKVDSVATRAISVWSDPACVVPINVNVLQDETTDLTAYVQLVDDATSYDAIASGWSTYNPTTGAIDATELLFNIDAAELGNSAVNPLTTRSLNTTVPGRFVIGQRGGGTVTDPGSLSGAAAGPGLAATGSVDVTGAAVLAALLLLAGVGLTRARATRHPSA